MARAEVIRTLLSARLLKTRQDSDGNTGNVDLPYIMAPIQSTYIQGLNAKRFANTFGSGASGGGVSYTRLVKDIVLADFKDTDGQTTDDDGAAITDLKFKYQEIQKVLIRTDIELTLAKKEKFFEDDLVDAEMINLVALVMGNIIEAHEIDTQSRRDDLLKVTATANSHVVSANFGEMTEDDGDGEKIYKFIQSTALKLVKQGMPDGEANPFHKGINRSDLVIEVNTYVGVALQRYLAFVNSKLNKDPHLFQGKIDSSDPKAQPVMVESDTYLGQIASIPVYENKWFTRDISDADPLNWTEDYFAIFPIKNQGAYGLPMRPMKTKMDYITKLSFYKGINTYYRFGIGAIRPETIYFGIKDASLTANASSKVTSVTLDRVAKIMQPLNLGDVHTRRMLAKEANLQGKINDLTASYKKNAKENKVIISVAEMLKTIGNVGAKTEKSATQALQETFNIQDAEKEALDENVTPIKEIKETKVSKVAKSLNVK